MTSTNKKHLLSYCRFLTTSVLSAVILSASVFFIGEAKAQSTEGDGDGDKEKNPDDSGSPNDTEEIAETGEDSFNPNVVVKVHDVERHRLPEVPVLSNSQRELEFPLFIPAQQLAAVTESEESELESDLFAFSITSEQSQRQPQKAPWLASSITPLEPETSLETQFAFRPSASNGAPAEKPDTPWITRALDTESEEEASRADLIARLNAATSDPEDSLEAATQSGEVEFSYLNNTKRANNWVSSIPDVLIAPSTSNPNSSVAAIGSPSVRPINPDSGFYDVNTLPQGTITPSYLANSNEREIAVDASQVEFLSPDANTFLNTPATSVVLRFPVGAKIALLVNGQPVATDLIGRTETDSETQLRTQTWYGVAFSAGENQLEVVSIETGQVLQSRTVTVKGVPTEMTLLSPGAIPADGRSTSKIRGQLLDELGNISRWESIVTLRTSDGEFLGTDANPDLPGFQVRAQGGEFFAELQSSLEAHVVQLKANTAGFEAFSQIQFLTPQRPSLVSGVVDLRFGARGTDYYDSYRDFLPPDGDNDYEVDVDAAVFATGNIGEWLYTGAYNSDRTLNQDCNGDSRLFRANSSNCDNTYATYGDDSQSDIVAPSLDSVYLRLERTSPSADAGVDYAMWGDFDTQEFSTASQLFTATNRQLHGFKTNYNFGDLAVTGLYANNVEGFQRDTIAPDGTSGYYFTSERNLVPGSEQVYLELEELERPGTVLDRQALARGADYQIDYDRGTILFNDPVTRTSVDSFGQLLVRRIVTTYQHEDGEDTNILAGRLQYNFDQKQGQASWIGTSYFAEAQGDRDFSLFGADAHISLGENTQLIAEVANSTSDFDTSDEVSGSAYRVELDTNLGRWLNGRAYFRSTDTGFSNAATTSFVPGQTRYGAQLSSSIGTDTTLRARFDQEENTGNAPRVITDLSDLLSGFENQPGSALDNSLTTYSFGLSQKIGRSTAEIDWLHRDRTDRLNSDNTVSSDQLRTRLTTPISKRLSLVAQNELNLSSNVDPIYPSRTLIGLNWEVMDGLNVGVNQLFYGGGGNDRGSATSIDVSGEHTFDSDTTIRGRFSTVDGRQIGGTIGLEQGINLAPGLDLDLGYEKVFSTLGNETAASSQFSQPFAPSRGASAIGLSGGESYSVGLSYTDNPDFQASTRFEHRSSRRSSNTVFNLSALGRITPELTLLGDYRVANAANQGITGLGTTSLLKLGMAYRNPDNDKFNALLRYEHRMNPNSIPSSANLGSSTETQEHLFSAEAIYSPSWRWELYGKYALRNSKTAFSGAGNDFSNSNTAQLAQARATYRLGYRWDTVGELRWFGSDGYSETGFSLEAGYYPLPDLRLSAGYSGGATDSDFGENRSAGGFYFGATAKLSGLLNGFGTQPSAPSQQQESAIRVSSDDLAPGLEGELLLNQRDELTGEPIIVEQ